MLLDNRYVEGGSTPISRTDSAGDIREQLEARGADSVDVIELPHYWYATYHPGAAGR